MLKITKNEKNFHHDADSFHIETGSGDKMTIWFWKRYGQDGSMSLVPDMKWRNDGTRPAGMAFVFDTKEVQQFITFLTEESNSPAHHIKI